MRWGFGVGLSVVGLLPLAGTLRLGCRSAQVLPAEGGEEHGGRQVHGRQVVGPGGQAGLGEQGLVPDDGQDLQRLLPGRVGQGDLVQNLWRETKRKRPLVINYFLFPFFFFFFLHCPTYFWTADYVLHFLKTICSFTVLHTKNLHIKFTRITSIPLFFSSSCIHTFLKVFIYLKKKTKNKKQVRYIKTLKMNVWGKRTTVIIRQKKRNSVIIYKYCVAKYENIPQVVSEYRGSVGSHMTAAFADCSFPLCP